MPDRESSDSPIWDKTTERLPETSYQLFHTILCLNKRLSTEPISQKLLQKISLEIELVLLVGDMNEIPRSPTLL